MELRHRYEGNKRVADRIKAVLLKNEGWKNKAIAQALRIHEETVRASITDWSLDEKLLPENGGSYSKLDANQSRALEGHLEETTYTRVIDICAYVECTFGVRYTVSGLTKWLHQHRFSYKQPKAVPAKANVSEQEAFIEKYLSLMLKVMNEQVRNNRFFTSPNHFRDAINEFFDSTIAAIQTTLRGRINDNLQIINPVLAG